MKRLGLHPLIATFLGSALASCTIKDLFGFKIHNDLSYAVVLEECAGSNCNSLVPPNIALNPGATSYQLVAAPDGTIRTWRITRTDGKIVGCLPFRFRKDPNPYANTVYPTSLHVPCGSNGGAQAIGNKDWPDPSL